MLRDRRRPGMNDPLYRRARLRELVLNRRARVAAFDVIAKGGDVDVARSAFPDLKSHIVDRGNSAELDFTAESAMNTDAGTTLQPRQSAGRLVRSMRSTKRLLAVTILPEVGRYALRFAFMLFTVLLKFVCWLICWWVAPIVLVAVTILGPIAASIIAALYVAAWFPVWGVLLTGFLVAAFLYYTIWGVDQITDAWMGIGDWCMDEGKRFIDRLDDMCP